MDRLTQTLADDGWPIDPLQPPAAFPIPHDVFWPKRLERSLIPLVIVCGPPASGKSTWVERLRGTSDVVIDLDDILVRMGYPPRCTDIRVREQCLRERNRMLAALAEPQPPHQRAWFITGAPQFGARKRWAAGLGARAVVVLEIPAEVCIERVSRDEHRTAAHDDQVAAIERWWRNYAPSPSDFRIKG